MYRILIVLKYYLVKKFFCECQKIVGSYRYTKVILVFYNN